MAKRNYVSPVILLVPGGGPGAGLGAFSSMTLTSLKQTMQKKWSLTTKRTTQAGNNKPYVGDRK